MCVTNLDILSNFDKITQTTFKLSKDSKVTSLVYLQSDLKNNASIVCS